MATTPTSTESTSSLMDSPTEDGSSMLGCSDETKYIVSCSATRRNAKSHFNRSMRSLMDGSGFMEESWNDFDGASAEKGKDQTSENRPLTVPSDISKAETTPCVLLPASAGRPANHKHKARPIGVPKTSHSTLDVTKDLQSVRLPSRRSATNIQDAVADPFHHMARRSSCPHIYGSYHQYNPTNTNGKEKKKKIRKAKKSPEILRSQKASSADKNQASSYHADAQADPNNGGGEQNRSQHRQSNTRTASRREEKGQPMVLSLSQQLQKLELAAQIQKLDDKLILRVNEKMRTHRRRSVPKRSSSAHRMPEQNINEGLRAQNYSSTPRRSSSELHGTMGRNIDPPSTEKKRTQSSRRCLSEPILISSSQLQEVELTNQYQQSEDKVMQHVNERMRTHRRRSVSKRHSSGSRMTEQKANEGLRTQNCSSMPRRRYSELQHGMTELNKYPLTTEEKYIGNARRPSCDQLVEEQAGLGFEKQDKKPTIWPRDEKSISTSNDQRSLRDRMILSFNDVRRVRKTIRGASCEKDLIKASSERGTVVKTLGQQRVPSAGRLYASMPNALELENLVCRMTANSTEVSNAHWEKDSPSSAAPISGMRPSRRMSAPNIFGDILRKVRVELEQEIS